MGKTHIVQKFMREHPSEFDAVIRHNACVRESQALNAQGGSLKRRG
jgi:hypothetical protein